MLGECSKIMVSVAFRQQEEKRSVHRIGKLQATPKERSEIVLWIYVHMPVHVYSSQREVPVEAVDDLCSIQS